MFFWSKQVRRFLRPSLFKRYRYYVRYHPQVQCVCCSLLLPVYVRYRNHTYLAVRRIRDVYPGSRFLPFPDRISDPASRIQKQQQKSGVKNLAVIPLFVAMNFTKLIFFIFEMFKKKIWANFQRIIKFLPTKLSLSSQKYGFGIRDPEKPIPDPGSGYATLHLRMNKNVKGDFFSFFFFM